VSLESAKVEVGQIAILCFYKAVKSKNGPIRWFVRWKERGKKIKDVSKKDEMLRDEMAKKIRQNMNATERDRRDKTENRKAEKRILFYFILFHFITYFAYFTFPACYFLFYFYSW